MKAFRNQVLTMCLRNATISHCVTVLCRRRLNHTPLFGNHLRAAWRSLSGGR